MFHKQRILLVDDELDLVTLARARLEVAGYEVLTANDGEEGLEKARLARPDLILLDIMMPKKDGYAVCADLKKNPQTQKIPIVIFTAKAAERDELLGYSCGADAYIRKPFDGKELLSQVQAFLPKPHPPSTLGYAE